MNSEPKMIKAMKIWKLGPSQEYLLPEICKKGDYFATEKIDGYWYQFEKTDTDSYLFSRNISAVTGVLTEKSENVPHIIEALSTLPANTIIIGEIFVPGGTSKNVTRIMGCLPEEAIKRQNEEGQIHFYMHDIIYYNGVDLTQYGAYIRYQILEKVVAKFNLLQFSFLSFAQKVEENILDFASEVLSRGGEGIVLKKKNAPYTPDKRPAWSSIKIKKTDTIDAFITGFEDATKIYNGKEIETWQYWEEKSSGKKFCGNGYEQYLAGELYPLTKPYFFGWKTAIKIGCLDEKGEVKNIGTISSGLTDALRQDFAEHPEKHLRRVVEIRCMEKDNAEKTLRHGFMVGFRDDKSAEDCLLTEIFSV